MGVPRGANSQPPCASKLYGHLPKYKLSGGMGGGGGEGFFLLISLLLIYYYLLLQIHSTA